MSSQRDLIVPGTARVLARPRGIGGGCGYFPRRRCRLRVECHALEHAQHGSGGGHERGQRASYLAQSWPETSSGSRVLRSETIPNFAEKLQDIVGLYLNPPEHALVLCVDKKSQIQALDRTQPGLPLKPGRRQTMTHHYKRNGTATLFAALNAANGEAYGLCQERHRHQEWLMLLRLLDQGRAWEMVTL